MHFALFSFTMPPFQALREQCGRDCACTHLDTLSLPGTLPSSFNLPTIPTLLQSGIHHIVLPAVLETPPGRDCYGHVEAYADRLVLHGVDTMMSLECPILSVTWQERPKVAMPAAVLALDG